MDLVGLTRIKILGGKRYCLVIVNDFSRLTWVAFLREKSKSFDEFKEIFNRIQNGKDLTIKMIRSDHAKKFKNIKF